MPDIPMQNQVFDLAFHPGQDAVYAGLLTGEIKGFTYDNEGAYNAVMTLRPTKKSCRGLAMSEDGSRLWGVSKDKSLSVIDTGLGTVINTKLGAHDAAINRVASFMPNMLATGDDDGVIKLWDPRKSEEIRAYKQHFDFISDFLWLEDKKHLVATSGDGTLSVMDIRSNKPEPVAQSEDQEDELLSIVAIKGNTKVVVGTQLGILSIFNRSNGWGDCVDRIPGHPSSIDALAALTPDVIATGSSDGMIRLVQILPSKLLGVVADHGEFPIERLRLDRRGYWLGSASHDDILKLTDIHDALEESEDEDGAKDDRETSTSSHETESAPRAGIEAKATSNSMSTPHTVHVAHPGQDSDSDEPVVSQSATKKKRKKKNKDVQRPNKKSDTSFFSEL